MCGPPRALIALLFAALLTATSAIGAPPGATHRVVAVGDLHGDFEAWRAIAQAAGIEGASGRWVGGATVFIQVGDVVDRGPASVKILQDLMRLQREAQKAGGRVIALVGNHEAMNMTHDLRYVSAGDYAAFTSADSQRVRDRVYALNQAAIEAAYHREQRTMTPEAIRHAWIAATPLGQIEHDIAWAPDGWIGRWVAHNPAVVLLDGTIFVHGGIGAPYARMSLAEIDQKVEKALLAADEAPEAIINDPDGPLWYRGYAQASGTPEPQEPGARVGEAPNAKPASANELDEVLMAYGAQRMVIGHTPILSGIAVSHEGRLIRIDTGISAVYGGKLTYLELIDGAPNPHEVRRSAP